MQPLTVRVKAYSIILRRAYEACVAYFLIRTGYPYWVSGYSTKGNPSRNPTRIYIQCLPISVGYPIFNAIFNVWGRS